MGTGTLSAIDRFPTTINRTGLRSSDWDSNGLSMAYKVSIRIPETKEKPYGQVDKNIIK